jgi:Cys-rich protein (TIGR01571 family)
MDSPHSSEVHRLSMLGVVKILFGCDTSLPSFRLPVSRLQLSMIFFFPPFFGIIVWVFVGAYYRERLRKKYNADVAGRDSLSRLHISARDFGSGLFDCFNGRKAVRKCCFACFCAPARWSADASATGFMDFWVALILTSIFITVMFVFGFIGRVHMRGQYNMEKATLSDFCSWLCCYSCALTQEAKFIDRGFRAIRDGRQTLELEEQVPVASVVEKRAPPTPGTVAPETPGPSGSPS